MSRDGSRFAEFDGRPLVTVPPVSLDERVVETLVPGTSDTWVTVPARDEANGIARTLESLRSQDLRPLVVCVVDNVSTDGTAAVVRATGPAFAAAGVGLRLVTEPELGTGAAADTGMRLAIANDARFLLRTDADAVARPDWARRMRTRLADGVDLVAGRVVTRDDEGFGRLDRAVIGGLLAIGAFVAVVRNQRPGHRTRFRLLIGANLGVRAEMYVQVDGFPRARIDEVHDDRAFMNRVRRVSDRVVSDHRAIVAASARRYRAYGLIGVLRWYLAHEPHGRPIDVR